MNLQSWLLRVILGWVRLTIEADCGTREAVPWLSFIPSLISLPLTYDSRIKITNTGYRLLICTYFIWSYRAKGKWRKIEKWLTSSHFNQFNIPFNLRCCCPQPTRLVKHVVRHLKVVLTHCLLCSPRLCYASSFYLGTPITGNVSSHSPTIFRIHILFYFNFCYFEKWYFCSSL